VNEFFAGDGNFGALSMVVGGTLPELEKFVGEGTGRNEGATVL
jgi:hypothetical protein